MKSKAVAVMLASMMSAGLIACGSTNSSSTEDVVQEVVDETIDEELADGEEQIDDTVDEEEPIGDTVGEEEQNEDVVDEEASEDVVDDKVDEEAVGVPSVVSDILDTMDNGDIYAAVNIQLYALEPEDLTGYEVEDLCSVGDSSYKYVYQFNDGDNDIYVILERVEDTVFMEYEDEQGNTISEGFPSITKVLVIDTDDGYDCVDGVYIGSSDIYIRLFEEQAEYEAEYYDGNNYYIVDYEWFESQPYTYEHPDFIQVW